MQFVVRSAGVTWELARRLGPYLILEILLPGGTLLALLLFLYRRRQSNGTNGARRNALTNQVTTSFRVSMIGGKLAWINDTASQNDLVNPAITFDRFPGILGKQQ